MVEGWNEAPSGRAISVSVSEEMQGVGIGEE
jgi:hypothetical protein